MEKINKEIGIRICQLRKERGLTQENLAEKLDITTKHVSAVERGISALSIEKMILLSEVLDCSLDYIIKGSVYISQQMLPSTIISILEADDEEEKKLLVKYLDLYRQLRNK